MEVKTQPSETANPVFRLSAVGCRRLRRSDVIAGSALGVALAWGAYSVVG
jgi:hypothetical protein